MEKVDFHKKRKEKITVRNFFNQRLLDVDGRFAKDVEYLLAAQVVVVCRDERRKTLEISRRNFSQSECRI